MADSVQDKQTKRKSEAIDEVLDDNLDRIASEIEKQDDVDSLDMRQEKVLPTHTSESIEDLLVFDAQILASSSAKGIDVTSDGFSQSIESQYTEDPDFNIIDEPEESKKSTKEIEPLQNEFVGESLFEYEQQDSNSHSVFINAQNEKIFQLQSELSVLKKMLAVQLDIDKRLEKSNTKFKIISVFALMIASFALLLNFWQGGAVDTDMQVVSGEPKKLAIEVNMDSVVPVNSHINDVQPQPFVVTENITPEKILVEPEDDISDIGTADNAQIKEWVVNLNSYEQLWEADKKIEELKEKGVVTEMIIVSVRGVRWYRIRITGFKTKAEASSYAATIKEILKVSHAWVSKL